MATRNRDLLFLGLAVAFLITAIWLVRRQAPPAAAPGASAPPAVARVAPPAPAPKAAELAAPKPLDAPSAQPARNPFAAPPGAVRAAEAAKKPAPKATAPAPVPPPVTPAPLAPTPAPAAPSPALPPLSSAAAPLVKASAGPTLSGVIGGSTRTPTAIIRDGSQRYFAKQGDKIGGRYTVQSVSSQTVVLVSAQGKLILKMGGS